MASIDIAKMSNIIQQTGDLMRKAHYQALLTVTLKADEDAKLNIRKNFTGRRGYTLSGRLLNSIRIKFNKQDDKMDGTIGSYGVPYARIHEYGGTIKPVNWKHLWLRLPATTEKASPWRRLQPSDFYKRAKDKKPGYYYATSKAGNKFAMYRDPDSEDNENNGMGTPLFWLRDKSQPVHMPARPYLRPAVKQANRDLKPTINQIFNNYLKRYGGI